jgi:DNA-binding NarL/FixJ family response regulator
LVLVLIETTPDSRRATPTMVRARLGLTHREAQVALLIAQGRRNGDIAAELGVTLATAKRHTEHILQKLGVQNRTAIAGAIHRLMGG